MNLLTDPGSRDAVYRFDRQMHSDGRAIPRDPVELLRLFARAGGRGLLLLMHAAVQRYSKEPGSPGVPLGIAGIGRQGAG